MPFQILFLWLVVTGWVVNATVPASAMNTGQDAGPRTVVDSRGVSVSIPGDIKRVVTISDGLIEGVMTVLGVQDHLAGIGSSCMGKTDYRFSYPVGKEKPADYENGFHTVTCLNRWIARLPQIAVWNAAPNYEKIAALDPDLMMVRVGCCWLSNDSDQIPKSIGIIESLGIPLVVLHSPNTYDRPNIQAMFEEIRIIGNVFDQGAKAEDLVAYLENWVKLVRSRTEKIPKRDRARILLLGLSSESRAKGGAGAVHGIETIDSCLLENVVHGLNAFQERGYFKTLNAEQILSLDPDAVILITAWGYHPPRELYEAPYYSHLRELRAVKGKRVFSLPFTPCNGDKRLEFPIDLMVMAKAAYPDLFADIGLAKWTIDFYRNVYGVDEKTAMRLRSAQWMDWTLESPF